MGLYQEEKLYKDTRVKILVDKESLIGEAFDEIIEKRKIIEKYIKENPEFLEALRPIAVKQGDPELIVKMKNAAQIVGVGPMAAVAGVLAEEGCNKIKDKCSVAVVENGGDIFAVCRDPVNVGIFAGETKLKDKLAFKLDSKNTPIAICSSSSFLGHSKSFGKCDLATVFSKDSAIADCAATEVGNRVKKEEDIEKVLNWAISLEGVSGVIIIKNDKIGIIGDVPELIKSKDKKLKEKVTRNPVYEL